MIPLKDENPTERLPVVTVAFIVINVLAFLYQISLGPAVAPFVAAYGAVPVRIFGDAEGMAVGVPASVTLLTSMFLHGGWFHLLGNMLYLWIFGNNIEDQLGHLKFVLFYGASGVLATLSHALVDMESQIPMIGASGAISGVLGAYLLLFPHAKVLALLPLGIIMQIVRVPAFILIGFWFFLQFLNGFMSLFAVGGGGVAWFAHLGGFAAGLLLIGLFRPAKWRSRAYAS
jgi:membrane associated rhomboid family serine protease